jgi:hypothetical protein
LLGFPLLSVLGLLDGFPEGKTDMLGEALTPRLGFGMVDSDGAEEDALESASITANFSLGCLLGLLDGLPEGKTDVLGEMLTPRKGSLEDLGANATIVGSGYGTFVGRMVVPGGVGFAV